MQKLSRARCSTRLRLDAARAAPPPRRESRPHGRPRRPGKRRATLEAAVTDDQTPWTPLTVDPWDAAGPREGDVWTDTAVWSHAAKPPVPRRWVLLRAPQGAFTPQAWLSTNPEQTPAPRLTWGVRRWPLAGTCAEARAHRGLETQRRWHARALGRPTPVVLRLEAIIPWTAPRLIQQGANGVRSTAWPPPTRPAFPLRSRGSGDTWGIIAISHRPSGTRTWLQFHMPGWSPSPRHSAMPRHWIKSSEVQLVTIKWPISGCHSGGLSHDLGDRLSGPVERMR